MKLWANKSKFCPSCGWGMDTSYVRCPRILNNGNRCNRLQPDWFRQWLLYGWRVAG